MVSQSSIVDAKPSSWPVSQRSLSSHRISELQESVKGAKSSFVEIRTEMDNNTKMLQRYDFSGGENQQCCLVWSCELCTALYRTQCMVMSNERNMIMW